MELRERLEQVERAVAIVAGFGALLCCAFLVGVSVAGLVTRLIVEPEPDITAYLTIGLVMLFMLGLLWPRTKDELPQHRLYWVGPATYNLSVYETTASATKLAGYLKV